MLLVDSVAVSTLPESQHLVSLSVLQAESFSGTGEAGVPLLFFPFPGCFLRVLGSQKDGEPERTKRGAPRLRVGWGRTKHGARSGWLRQDIRHPSEEQIGTPSPNTFVITGVRLQIRLVPSHFEVVQSFRLLLL